MQKPFPQYQRSVGIAAWTMLLPWWNHLIYQLPVFRPVQLNGSLSGFESQRNVGPGHCLQGGSQLINGLVDAEFVVEEDRVPPQLLLDLVS